MVVRNHASKIKNTGANIKINKKTKVAIFLKIKAVIQFNTISPKNQEPLTIKVKLLCCGSIRHRSSTQPLIISRSKRDFFCTL